MGRIPFVPMLPVTSRYTVEWLQVLSEHPRYAMAAWVDSQGEQDLDTDRHYNYFTNLEPSVEFECAHLLALLRSMWLSTDRLLVLDFDFPGLAVAAFPLFRLKFPALRLYALVHAGSWGKGDIFQGDKAKPLFELAALRSCHRFFVASEYHAGLIRQYFGGMDFPNMFVLGGFPFHRDHVLSFLSESPRHDKGLLVAGRKQQIDLALLSGLEYEHFPDPIPRPEFVQRLSRYKAVIIPKIEDTFGLMALEAASVGTIPIVPDAFAYKETMPCEFRYRHAAHLRRIVRSVLVDPAPFQVAINSIAFDRYARMFDVIADVILRDSYEFRMERARLLRQEESHV